MILLRFFFIVSERNSSQEISDRKKRFLRMNEVATPAGMRDKLKKKDESTSQRKSEVENEEKL